MGWYFHYQVRGKEDTWQMALSSDRSRIIKEKAPAFSTVLDLSMVPEDNDWSKVTYQGPYYVDFDADDDLDLACQQFKLFLLKLQDEFDFDLSQASLYASGSKGFHIEIPQECFIPKPPARGTAWLPYVYREVSQALYLDTLDLNVYSGKRGRQWRTVNVQRENGMYKVPLTLEEAWSITPDEYRVMIRAPRPLVTPTPPHCNTKLALAFDRAKEKTVTGMRGKKKRQEKSSTFLAPWKKAGKTPPSIESIMRGEGVAEGAGFQAIAMQLAIYATSVDMPLEEFLQRCAGLCSTHTSDSRRYNSVEKRQAELTRMWEYMSENTLYDFDTAPVLRLLAEPGKARDLGSIEKDDPDDKPSQPAPSQGDSPGDPSDAPAIDPHANVRRGFYMNSDGMFVTLGEHTQSICRATVRNVIPMFTADTEKPTFKGYEFDVVVAGRKLTRTTLSFETFTAAAKMRQFFAAHQIAYSGGENETIAMLDKMAEKARAQVPIYTYPREGFFLVRNPVNPDAGFVKCYLTQDHFLSSLSEDDPDYFKLRYLPEVAAGTYNLDLHQAPELDETMAPAIHDLLSINAPSVVADLLGWFVAAHYRHLYHVAWGQFPLLHLWGEAGAGKTKSVELLSRLHWFRREKIQLRSASSSSSFALDVAVSTSTSAPLIIDEWKPKELKTLSGGRYQKLKDVLKVAYMQGDIGNRGTVNRGAESSLGVIKQKAMAPIVFMAEAIEAETAIFERSIVIGMNQDMHKGNAHRTAAFERLYEDEEYSVALPALGREIIEMGFSIEMSAFKREIQALREKVKAAIPEGLDDTQRRAAPRLIANRVVILHALSILKRILNRKFGAEFDEKLDEMVGSRTSSLVGEEGAITHIQGMSEVSKTLTRIALNSRASGDPWEVKPGVDYLVGDGWVEIRVEAVYDRYRRYCSAINDTPLFDTVDGFVFSLMSYSATTDRLCTTSELRKDGSTERIFRLSLSRLLREGVQSFRV